MKDVSIGKDLLAVAVAVAVVVADERSGNESYSAHIPLEIGVSSVPEYRRVYFVGSSGVYRKEAQERSYGDHLTDALHIHVRIVWD